MTYFDKAPPPHTAATAPAPRFWCDDFDGDLLKLVPEAAAILDPARTVMLCTHGSARDGKLVHPTVWNHEAGMVAYFGAGQPHKPEYCWTDKPVVHCTLEEAMRDAFVHGVTIVLQGRHVVFHGTSLSGSQCELLAHARGWKTLRPGTLAALRGGVLDAVRRCVELAMPLVAAAGTDR